MTVPVILVSAVLIVIVAAVVAVIVGRRSSPSDPMGPDPMEPDAEAAVPGVLSLQHIAILDNVENAALAEVRDALERFAGSDAGFDADIRLHGLTAAVRRHIDISTTCGLLRSLDARPAPMLDRTVEPGEVATLRPAVEAAGAAHAALIDALDIRAGSHTHDASEAVRAAHSALLDAQRDLAAALQAEGYNIGVEDAATVRSVLHCLANDFGLDASACRAGRYRLLGSPGFADLRLPLTDARCRAWRLAGLGLVPA